MTKLSFKKSLLVLFCLVALANCAKAQPANDNPCAAAAIPVGATCTFTQYTTVGATNTPGVGNPGCANYNGGDVWFSAVVPASGSITFDTNTGGMTDGGMAVYTGTCGALTLIDCNDDGSANGLMPSLTETGLTPGTIVFIRVWEYGNDNQGTFSICAQAGPTCNGTTANASCASAEPFCTGVSYDYCNTTGVPSLGGGGMYGCLLTAPNPAFYFMNIASSGPVTFNISQQTFGGVGIDVDFVLWGPFASQGAMCAGLAAGNIVDCSYSTAAVETATIPAAVAGQWYMMLITNYSDQAGVINFNQTNSGNAGAGVTNCNIVTASPGVCSGGFFTLTGAVTVPAPPASGTLTVTNSCGGSQVINAPFTSPINYSIPNICGNGATCSVTAVFSAGGAPVILPTNYTEPSCNTLTATPGACVAGGYALSGTLTTGCLPATGTLTISSSCGGTVVFNAPFTSPLAWSLPVSNGTGGSCTVTAVYSAPGAPVITPFVFTEPSCCGSNAGTLTVTHTGGTQSTLANGTTQVILCPGGTVKIVSNGDFTLPGAGCLLCTAGLMYAIYTAAGPTVPDPDLDPNWTGYYWTGQTFTTANSGGFNTNSSGSCSPLLTLPPVPGFASPSSPTNTLLFVPITADAVNLPYHDNNGDGCYDIGDPVSITYLNPVSFSPTPACDGSVSVNITGGYPQFFPAFYTLTNTGAGTLASTTVSSGGNAVITGLTPGQTYSLSVNDGNGCTATYSGLYSGPPTVSIVPASTTICTGGCVNLVANVTSGVGPGTQTFSSNQCSAIADDGVPTAINPPTAAGNWSHTSINVAGVCAPTWNTGEPLTVCLNIAHTFVADLHIYLQAPNGTYYLLSSGNGGLGANYTGTCFSATAATNITAGTAPFSAGPYKPQGGTGNYAALNGTPINGNWSLWVGDDFAGDVGTLNNWSITFTNENTYTYAWSPTAGLSATNILNPNACPAASTTYSLTVTNSCGCPATATATVNVTSSIIPTFNTVPAICSGDPAPVLPTTSTNGITGSWAPAVSNTATGTYTFTPGVGQCATTTTLTVTVNPLITPTFNPVAAICSGDPAPVLPTTSTNGITGSWAPAVSNTATGTYTFTPNAGQCATTTTLAVTVNPLITPTFNAVAAICSGDPAPVLPTTSTNGITGTWAPAVSNTATGTYTFTPNAGQCATTTTLTVTVNPLITPTFNAVAAICSGDPAPVLPTTSTNGITGTWAPAVSNTATGTYTFTPNAGQCATTTTLAVTVNPLITPTFNAVAAICSGDPAPVLPTTSTNGITGTWAPAVSNTATGTYTFTPNAGQCATTTTLTVTVNPLITPTFNAVAAICSGDPAPVLPTTSTNGITGTWAPAVSNTATGTYTFTPNAGQCATTTTLTVTVNPLITPTFNAVAAICSGDPAPVLPTTSTNGITGSWVPAVSNTATGTYTFTPDAGQCAVSTTLTVTVNPLITPTFNAVAAICSGDPAPVLPTTSTNGITGTWAPAVSNTATGTYTFTPDAGQCAVTTTLTVTVNPLITPTFNAVAAICSGDPAPVLPTTSTNGITGSWAPAVSNTATGTYTFTPDAGQCAVTTTLTVTVNPLITPTFNAVAAICSGDPAPVLPTTSTNGITGTWAPAVSNTATGTYTFTPDAGQCAVTTTLTVTVNPLITPTFNAVAAICSGDPAPVLPTTSTNGITGSWAPAVSNTATGTYTFTPDAGQCAVTTTLTVTVNPLITPTFNAVAAICSGDPAPVLPTTSTNGITGTWAPAVSNTATGTYTFTPDAGQCAVTTTLTVTVNPLITPTFNAVAAICSGDPAPVLPTTSTNGITGTWAPAVSNTATGTYTFTPDAGQCATTTTLTVTVNPLITPTFNAVAAICSGDPAPVLPTTSTNGITGTWAPAVSNTATGTYTFTPDAGQCAVTTTLTVTVNPLITPTFNAVAAICSGDPAPVLPTTSTNGITGSWAPAVSNTATGTYTFTPDAGQCAVTTTLTVTVNPLITPTFNAVAAICSGDPAPVLPTTSTNGITGTWAPAVSNTATGTYTFTPNAGQCATTTTLTVTVNPLINPTFNAVAAICSGDPAPVLPTTSINGITGTWSPAVSNTATGTYTFTPDPGQCAVTTTLTVTVNPLITPTFNAVAAICSGDPAPVLPTTSTNGITGSWAPAVSNTATGTYTFTPDAGQCAVTTTLTVTVNPLITPTFNAVAAICSGDPVPVLPTTSTNGITGSWAPAVSNTATGTYTFTPDPGQCAVTTTLTVTVNPLITPAFNAVAAICSGDPAPVLPTTSTNGITGTWAPAVSNTATGTYTFTPDLGQCAVTTTLTVTVNPLITPTFNAVAAICSGDPAPVLPTTSTNGITGTWAPAVSNTATGTYTFTPDPGQCAVTTTLIVTVNPLITPTFNAVAAICSGDPAPVLPTTSTNGITGTWAPAVSNTATGTYTFTPDAGQCAVTTTLTVTVNPLITPTFNAVAAICSGDPAPVLPTTSTNGITGTWAPAVSNTATGTYTFTPDAGQCAVTTTLTVTVNPLITPTFNAVAAICSGDPAPVLPTTSTNGITGTWAPAVSNTATGTYTFTPDAGQCAVTTTLTVTVNPLITPTFNAVAAICSGDPAPVLPTTSTNGITGTWAPAVSNTATGTYTFTPDAGQCAVTTTLTVTVNPLITPTFNAVAAICSGDPAPVLPTTSTNGITGTWAPAVSNTATGTYTFTPDAGQCAVTTTLTVTVNPLITPTFNAVAAICSGDPAPVLPTTSTNGITGTWAPAVSNTATGTYTFTPDAGQCAVTTTLTVTVNPLITPTFNAVAAICSGDPAPVLPTTSTNGITGTWAPAVSNTATGTYTFTPDAGQCAVTTTLTVTVNPLITPTFNAVAAICSGDPAPVLPTTSTNGITGTWAPAVSNTATGTYTFTPDPGQCAVTTTLIVTVNPLIIPTFNAVAAICSGDPAPVLPTTSTNGITGTWAPAVSNAATGTYTFTPDAGQCAVTTTLTVTVNPLITPTFNAIAAICSGDPAPVLPTTSTNGITGTWAPAVSNTATGTYTFTPDAGQCAVTTTLTVTVNPLITPTFNAVAAICSGDPAPVLPTTSTNGITGTWSPAVSNTATGTYTFTPDAGQCATTTTLTVTVNPLITPTFNAVAAICSGDPAPVLPTTSTNGITGSWAPAVSNTATGTYTFTPNAGQCAVTTTLTVTVNPLITPTFNAVAAICSGDPAPVLPTTSTNGITGTWAPAVSNTATGTYTFTPDAGQCATITTLTVTVNSNTTPAFNAIPAICSGDPAPVLPTTSTNGITGTWAPAVSNTATGTYTFTPDAGQCAVTTTLTIIVNPKIIPTFAAISPICSGTTAPVLPTTSTNGITGTWIPAVVNNTTSASYTFTPGAGQCAALTSITITVNSNTAPIFNAIAPICSGDPAPVLPTTSTNGITGTWAPATVDNTGTGTYTFTPDAGPCAATTTLTVTVNPLITPAFNAVAAICSGDALATLPTTSTNGINGTWSPALDNTATTTYTFNPAAGQCAVTTTLTITVNPLITPTFTPVAAICSGDVLAALPATSTNGINGVWAPVLNNTATTIYTFTPAAGQCAVTTTLTITVNPLIIPTFNVIAAICSGDPAPVLTTTSTNGITGTWTPAVSNTATGTYTFTPGAGQCATTTTLTITVNPLITPTFNAVAAICSGDALTALPTTSTNGINGTWSPALDNTATTTYTFTPNAGQCATTTTLTITVNPILSATVNCGVSTTTSVTFTWAAVTGATGYNVSYQVGAGPIVNVGAIGNVLTYPVSGLTSGDNVTITLTPTGAAGTCFAASTATCTATACNPPTANISYATPFCASIATAQPVTLTGTGTFTGGTYTASPAGLTIDASTGDIIPSTSTAATYTVTYTIPATAGCSIVTATTSVTIDALITPTFAAVAAICSGDVLVALPTTSVNGINGTWAPALNNTATTTYTFTPAAGGCATTTTLTITVNPLITPTFVPVAAICSGDILATLPVTSTNGITGTWAPALDNTTTTTYTFTPGAGQCATTTTLTITVNPPITPTFNAVAAICSGDPAPVLPTTSTNSITGTWTPAVSNTATGTYTFTPDAGQCATTTTLTITVNPLITPSFNAVAAICSGDALATLPTTSTNGINGTWSPALDNTATTTYTFTPNAGQCATTTTLTITVNPILSATVNCGVSTTTSVTFTWAAVTGATGYNVSYQVGAGPIVNVGAIGNALTYPVSGLTAGDNVTITITPTGAAGTCFTASTATCTATACIPPTANISYATPFCASITTAQPVTLTGTGTFTGGTYTASPAGLTIDASTGDIVPSTSTAATYTVTYNIPATAGCSIVTATTSVTVDALITPTFAAVAAICSGDVLVTLPTTSDNGINGTWAPALNNTATTTYTFTPNAGQCATTTTLTITVNPLITPTFAPVAAICSGDPAPVLPTTSANGITGTWAPAVSNTATGTYTFTPGAGQCAAATTLTVTVNPLITPTFNAVAAICSGDALTALPTTSTNGINGTWSPALDNTATTTYTFTPNAGQCATTTTLTITANPILSATVNCGVSTTTSVTFTWAAVTGATGYNVSYQVGAGPIVNVGAIGNVLTYPVSGLTSGDNVTITLTPTGAAGTCFTASTATCTATACNPPTANISYATPFCASITTAQPVTLTGTGTFTGGTYTASPAGLTIDASTGDILPSTSTAATYTVTYTIPASAGCSIVTATTSVTIDAVVTPSFAPTGTMCFGMILDPLSTTSPNGIHGTWSPAVNSTTTTTYTFTPGAGECATTTTFTMTVIPVVTSTTNIAICNTQLPYNWNGNNYPGPGTYSVTLTSAAGCDSIATLNLAINPVVTSVTNITICNSQLPYSWNGNSYPAAGTYSVTLISAAGCDSVATLNLTANTSVTSTTGISICNNQLPYSWNGNSYPAAGTYSVTLVSSAGCDSIATLNLTANAVVTSTTNITICNSQFPYSWNGNSYPAAGTYSVTLVSSAGCDSIATLNLSMSPAVTSTTNITICNNQLPYSWNGNSYPAAGTYSVTLVNSAGCDSIATLNLTANAVVISTTGITICNNQLPYSWNGNSYPAAGTYSVTLISSAGCDSIATLNLTANAVVTSTTGITICNNQLPYSWNGNSYPAAGTYSVTLVSSAGCDSIATLNLTANAVVTSTTNITICNGLFPYSWNGNSYPAAGTYSVTLVSSSGCDSIATLNLSMSPAVTSTTNITICNNQLPYSWNGNSYPAAGTYAVTLANTAGCDSIATLNLTANAVVTSTSDIAICNNQLPYSWNGNSYPAAGTYSVTLVSAGGCDSIATLNLTANAAVTSTTDITICNNQLPYSWNGNSYPAAGTYSVTLAGSSGCDSIATLNLVANAVVTSTTDITICNNQLPYSWNGNSYPVAGTYPVTLVSSSGCDSIATLNLTINAVVTSTTNITICNSQFPYSWNSNSYPAAGTYTVTLISSAGCDSTATLNLSMSPAVTSTTNITICNNQLPYSWNGNSYPAAGTYSVNLVNTAGCDSIATLNLTANAVVTSSTDITICNNQLPYSWNGNSYPAAGTYSVTLVSAGGCDSIATLNLTANAVVTSSTNITICNNQLPYSWNGNSYPTAGTYSVTLVSAGGCDSTATLNLTANAVVTSTTNITICNNQLPYSWNGNSYPAAGTYSVTLVSAGGCDSIATLNLTANAVVTSTTNITICNNQLPYSWNGNSYPAAGTYSVTLVSAGGCDSIATLNLTANAVVTSTTNITICNNQLPYSWNGNNYPAAGTYSVTLVSAGGCDSIATLNLTANAVVTSTTDITICNNQLPYSWNSNSYPAAGTYSVTLVSAGGCDSIATLNLTANAVVTSTTNITICNNQLPYNWNGNSYPAAGTYTVTLISSAGCDSIATLNLVTNPVVTSTTNLTICHEFIPYTWNGNSYPAAGTYSVTLVSTAGCDSIATLNLTVNPVPTSITNITICSNQLPYNWNGNNYPVAGTYSVTLVSNANCDSIVTLNLTVNPVVTSSTNITICTSQLPYSWNGNSYPVAGTYSVTLTSSGGCDSIATLNLAANAVVISNTPITICNNQLPYSWNGNSYPAAGTYSVTLVSSAGCDSIATLNLTVNFVATSTTPITICNSQLPYSWNGNSYPAGGTYSVTLATSGGCDSTATLNLTVNPATTSTTSITICNNQLPYNWNGNSYPAAGTYAVTLVNNNGCDSVATLVLAANSVITSSADITICNNQLPYSWNGNSYPAAGTYSVTLVSSGGCDSVATLHLLTNPVVTSTTNFAICNTLLPYSWNGNSYPAAGSYAVTLVSSAGCDSVATLNLTVKMATSSSTPVTICSTQLPYLWNGQSYATGGAHIVTLVNAAGCDSVATLNLTVNLASSSLTPISICSTQLPYSWNGQSYSTAGSHVVTLVNAAGCDSVATLVLTVNPVATSLTPASTCSTQLPYSWNGQSYTTAGNHSVTLVSAAGCDSIATLNLTINPVATSTTSASTCDNQLPYSWNGNSYAAAGTYTVTLTGSAGCDSIATLHLASSAVATSLTTITVCSGELPYNWNGQPYSTGGPHAVTLTSASNCDSIATLDLTINTTPALAAVTSPVVYCQHTATAQLTATITTAGSQLVWYDSPAGGTGSATAPIPSSSTAGTISYYVSQLNGSCEGPRALITVTVNSAPDLTDQATRICTGQTANISALYNTTGFTSNWTFNQQPVADPTAVNVPGSYLLIAGNASGCQDTAIVSLGVNPTVTANAGPDANIVINEPHQLNGSGGLNYQWSPSLGLNDPHLQNPTATVSHDQSYVLMVTDDIGCFALDTVNLRVFDGPAIYVPSAFTPNGDNLNDYFRPTYVNIVKLEYFAIFNRYGEMMYETHDLSAKGWDGIYKGKKQPISNYVWHLKAIDNKGEIRMMKGNAVLIR